MRITLDESYHSVAVFFTPYIISWNREIERILKFNEWIMLKIVVVAITYMTKDEREPGVSSCDRLTFVDPNLPPMFNYFPLFFTFLCYFNSSKSPPNMVAKILPSKWHNRGIFALPVFILKIPFAFNVSQDIIFSLLNKQQLIGKVRELLVCIKYFTTHFSNRRSNKHKIAERESTES